MMRIQQMTENRYELNKNLAQMLKGGVIMDVQNPEQARIAEKTRMKIRQVYDMCID